LKGSSLTLGSLGLLLLPTLLTACGFHFRQAPDLPPSMRHIYIAAPGDNGALVRELRRDLSSDDTEIMLSPEGATTTLSIIDVSHSSRPMALSLSGEPLEYQVTYQVEFSLLVQGATIMEPQTVDLKRTYSYSITDAIANEEQEQNLEDALSRDVAQFIVYRVVAAARSLSPSLAALPATTQAPPAVSAAKPATTAVPAPAVAPPPAV